MSSLPHLRSKTYPRATAEQKARRNPPPPIRKYYSNRELTALMRYHQNHPHYIPTVVPSNWGYELPEPAPQRTILRPTPRRQNAFNHSQRPQQRPAPTSFRQNSSFQGRPYYKSHSQSQSPKSSTASSRSTSSARFNPLPTITLKMLAEAKRKAAEASKTKSAKQSSSTSPGSRYSVLSDLLDDSPSSSLKSSKGGKKKMVQVYVPKSGSQSTCSQSSSSDTTKTPFSKLTAAQKGKGKSESTGTPPVVQRARVYAAAHTPPSMPTALKIYDGRKQVSPFESKRHWERVQYVAKNSSSSSSPTTSVGKTPVAATVPKTKSENRQRPVRSLTDAYVQAENQKFLRTTANMTKAAALSYGRSTSEPCFLEADENKFESLVSFFQDKLKGMRGAVRVHVAGRVGERAFCKAADEVGYKVGPNSVSRILTYVYGQTPIPSDISIIVSKRGWAHIFQNGFYVGYAPLSMPKWTMIRLAGEQRVYPTIVGNGGCYQIRVKDRWPTLQEYIMADLFHGYSKLDDVWVYDPVKKRAHRGCFGFCWLPLYLKSGCSVMEIPSCPLVRKGDLEKRFGRQKYIWNGDLLHLAPAYGSYIDGENNRLVGAAEIEEISDSLPNLTADSSLGDMVSNVLKRTVLTNNSRFALTLDEVLNSALTASLTQKKHTRLRIPQVLTVEEKQLLEKVWGHNNFEWGSNTPSPHAFLNAMRAVFNQEYSRCYRHLQVSDVGGNCVTHVLNGDLNVHVCNPICDAKDFNRHLSTIPTLLNEALNKRNNSAEFSRFMMALRAMSTCRKTISQCAVPSTVITMVDVYDISLSELVMGMESKGCVCARLCFMYPPELISASGLVVYPHTNLSVERIADQVVWCVGQCGDAYVHNAHNVLSYLKTARYVSPSGLLYHVELVAQRGPYMDFCISLTQPTSPLRNAVRKYMTWRGEYSLVRVVVNNPYPHVRTMYLERDFCRRTVMYLGNVCSSFEDRTFEYAVSALRSNMTMMVVGAKIVHKKVEISNDVVFEVASSLLREAVNRRTTTVRFHKSALNMPNKIVAWLRNMWQQVVQFVRSLLGWMTAPADAELADLMSGAIPYVEDVPDSIMVNLSDATSDVRLLVGGLDDVFDLAAQVAWKAHMESTSANMDKKTTKSGQNAEEKDRITGKNVRGGHSDAVEGFELDDEVPRAGLFGGGEGNWYDFLLKAQRADVNGDCSRAKLWRLLRKLTRLVKNWKKIPILGWAAKILGLLMVALKWVYEKLFKPDLPNDEPEVPQTVGEKMHNWFSNLMKNAVTSVQTTLTNMAASLSKKVVQVVELAAKQLQQKADESMKSAFATLHHNIACFREAMLMKFNKKAIIPEMKKNKWAELSALIVKNLCQYGPYVACSTAVFSVGWYIYHNETCRNKLLAGWQYLKTQTVHKYYIDKVKCTFVLLGLMIDVPCFSFASVLCPEKWMYLLSVGSLGRRVMSGSVSYCKLVEAVLLLNRVSELKDLLIHKVERTTADVTIQINAAEAFKEEQLIVLQAEYIARMKKALLTPVEQEKITNLNQVPVEESKLVENVDKIVPIEKSLPPPSSPKEKLMADAIRHGTMSTSKGKEIVVKFEKGAKNDFEASVSGLSVSAVKLNEIETTTLTENVSVDNPEKNIQSVEIVDRPPLSEIVLNDVNEKEKKDYKEDVECVGERTLEEQEQVINAFLSEYGGGDDNITQSEANIENVTGEQNEQPATPTLAITQWQSSMSDIHRLVAESVMSEDDRASTVSHMAQSDLVENDEETVISSAIQAAPYMHQYAPSTVSVVSAPQSIDVPIIREFNPLPWERFLHTVGIEEDIYHEFLNNIPQPRNIPTIVKNQPHVDILEFLLYVTHECATIMTLLKRAVHGSLVWDPRRKVLTCPMLHEKDCKPLKMFNEFKPFSYISEGLHFYPTVVADFDTKRIAFAEDLYETKGPFFCVGDVTITHSVIKLRGIMFALRRYDNNLFEDKQISYINAVPGAGKTYSIITRAKTTTERLLILTANRASSDELKIELEDQRKKGLVSVATLDSALMHLDRIVNTQFEELWVDECYMVHVGHINLLLGVIKAKKVVMLGDRRQIPFINRLKGVAICHSFMNIDMAKLEEKCITYRCPADICWWLSQCRYGKEPAYGQMVKTAAKLRVLKSVKAHPIQSITPDMVEDKEKIMVFTQWEKEKLSADFVNGGRPDLKRKISTVHECQGKTFSSVALVRVKPAMDEVFNSMPHRLVALTRHTTSLDFYCIRSRIDQGIGRDVELIEKVTEYVAKTFVIQQCS
uniref:ORF1 n=1 Tax=Manihot esculenta associated ampelovirus 1 TaxID=2843331 RepID=A0A8F0K5P7_9CLOS|nr:ORF1 [Manihot esculenta associated ampelovirus 1]